MPLAHGLVKAPPSLDKPFENLPRIIAVTLIVPCFYFGYLSIQWGMADRYAWEARQLEKQWKADKVTRPSLAEAVAEVQKAIAAAPGNSAYRDQLARYLTLQYLLDKQPAIAERAKEHLALSKELQPNSPRNLAAHIDLKKFSGEIDAELSELMIAAVKAGPWEPVVIQSVTRAGVAHYQLLSAAAQQATIDTIHRGLVSTVPGIPAQTFKFIEQGVAGWSVPFTAKLGTLLVNEPWAPQSQTVNAELALLLWPLLENRQRAVLSMKVADALLAQRGRVLLRKVAASGQLPLVCLHLPRNSRFNRVCQRSALN